MLINVLHALAGQVAVANMQSKMLVVWLNVSCQKMFIWQKICINKKILNFRHRSFFNSYSACIFLQNDAPNFIVACIRIFTNRSYATT